MYEKSIAEIADEFGIVVEQGTNADDRALFRLYKGAKKVFDGTEAAARTFFARYKRERPQPYFESTNGYKE